MFTAYSVKFVKIYKNYVSGVLDEAKTRFTPSIRSETINAATASREYENSEYICTFMNEQHILYKCQQLSV
jgi:hypothetical protein